MRLPSALFQQLAIGRGGAQLEPGDGELLLTPDIRSSFPVVSPMFSFATLPSPVRQSAHGNRSFQVAGVAANGALSVITLAAGIWLVEWVFNFHFTGTTTVGNECHLRMEDPSNNIEVLARRSLITGGQGDQSGRFVLTSAVDGFEFILFADATVAGDVLGASASVYAGALV